MSSVAALHEVCGTTSAAKSSNSKGARRASWRRPSSLRSSLLRDRYPLTISQASSTARFGACARSSSLSGGFFAAPIEWL